MSEKLICHTSGKPNPFLDRIQKLNFNNGYIEMEYSKETVECSNYITPLRCDSIKIIVTIKNPNFEGTVSSKINTREDIIKIRDLFNSVLEKGEFIDDMSRNDG